ncbi:ribosome 60S biogenesis N-terminal-domain-containing protein [Exophiala viscosa]|uniref:Ribosome 60S biogenesis N-terminal-domain-containing protein n=1 Tax=Exophiala viscosa TaxID=2486360 RepID=A0AAN6DQ87_9EURO|nr:ribosome 60S biogenesis N-terminal-domain-containing protein [Exophiala viscosa]
MAAGEEHSRKKRRVGDSTSASLESAHELKSLLHPSQKSSAEIKSAVDRFSKFLTSITGDGLVSERERPLKILRDYCDDQSSSSHDQVDFPDLLTAWSNASQSSDEAVLTAVPSALVRFFQTTSSKLEFRDFGLSLCHSLLKRDQVRLLDRGLSAPRAKESLITPCLKLLTEVISFDAGALASNVWARRDLLYRRLDAILGQPPLEQGGPQNFTARRAALDFLVANLRYLDTAAKSELITQGKTLATAIRCLPNERSDTAITMVRALEDFLANDSSLSRQLKARCFNSGNLTALAKLYDVETQAHQPAEENGTQGVREAVHHLLLQVCTMEHGILLPQSGWYPTGTHPDVVETDDDMIDLGLDSPYHFDDYSKKVPIRNGTVATFLQTLHPEKDTLQSNLIKSIFAAAPELVADYFSKKQEFHAQTSDDPIWRGQFAFLFSVVQSSVPPYCGWHGKLPALPPPVSVVIESILPRPLDRTTITRCLHLSEDIMTISGARLLTIALGKLESVITMFESAHPGSHVWDQTSSKLISLFIDRIPTLYDTITTLQRLSKDNDQVRTAVLECIAAYHRVLPSLAAGSKFDIGPLLNESIHRLLSDNVEDTAHESLEDQLPHLVHIAALSPATKWFQKANADSLILVTQLLGYCARNPDKQVLKQSMPVLRDLLRSKGILGFHTKSLEALLLSLTPTKKWQPDAITLQFLDNCITRTMQRPVKYLDQLERYQEQESDSKDLSLVACCAAEQWPFVVKKEGPKGAKNVAEWIAKLFAALDAAGENFRVITKLKEEMASVVEGDEKSAGVISKAFDKQQKKPVTLPEPGAEGTLDGHDSAKLTNGDHSASVPVEEAKGVNLAEVLPPPSAIPTSLKGLDRWTKPDFESEIQSGRLANLLRCLISPDQETRLQAFHTLQTVTHAVEQSTYPEKTQLHLLLGEVGETIRTLTQSHPNIPPPSIVAELAIHTLPVIADPSSPYYRKTNKYLLDAPSWAMNRILPHWMSETFLSEPEADDTDVGNQNAQGLEIERLLDLLADSLRSEIDMDLFRRSHVFTRLFSYYLAPVCSKTARKKILRIVHHAANVKDGSDTLITRAGVREWLTVAAEVRDHSGHGATAGQIDEEIRGIVKAVEKEGNETCDRGGIEKWERERPIYRLDKRTQSGAVNGHVTKAGHGEGQADEEVED